MTIGPAVQSYDDSSGKTPWQVPSGTVESGHIPNLSINKKYT